MGLDDEIARQRAEKTANDARWEDLNRKRAEAITTGRRLAQEFAEKARALGIQPTEFTNTVHGEIRTGFRRFPSERQIRKSISTIHAVTGWQVCYGLIVSTDGRFWKHSLGAHSGPHDYTPDEPIVEYVAGGSYVRTTVVTALAKYFA